jgi:hypothetical protein
VVLSGSHGIVVVADRAGLRGVHIAVQEVQPYVQVVLDLLVLQAEALTVEGPGWHGTSKLAAVRAAAAQEER